MYFPKNTNNDLVFIPTVMMLYEYGYSVYPVGRAFSILEGKPRKNIKQARPVVENKDIIYKVWPENRQSVLDAIKVGFFNKETAGCLIGLIYDDDVNIRGYTAHKCKLSLPAGSSKKIIEILIKWTKLTGYCLPDCLGRNFGVYKGRLTIVDFDSVSPIRKGIGKYCRNSEYGDTIERLVDEKLSL